MAKKWSFQVLFTCKVGVRVFVKYHEWVQWQQVMVFTLNVCIFKQRTAKVKEKCKR